MPTVQLFQDDALAILRGLDADSIDSIITDPPYGMSSRFSVSYSRFLGHQGKRRGFQGNGWDAALPDPEVWREALRVLKPGGFLVAFGGTATYHRLATAIEDAGFVVRDMIEWVHCQGMPKWFDVAQQLAKLNAAYAKNFEGWQLNLKPAHEPAVLAQKPISEHTYAANIVRWGVGALNAEACRSPFIDDKDKRQFVRNFSAADERHESDGYESAIGAGRTPSRNGRYPADVVTTDVDALGPGGHVFYVGDELVNVVRCRKASQRERTCEGEIENHHPTVKPLGLLRWLIRLVTPSGGTVLDPFAGSGTTGVAALDEACNAILVEREPEYVAIANARLAQADVSLVRFRKLDSLSPGAAA
jgi:site-specific DNA-methyltransferase (adenine-specific)